MLGGDEGRRLAGEQECHGKEGGSERGDGVMDEIIRVKQRSGVGSGREGGTC